MGNPGLHLRKNSTDWLCAFGMFAIVFFKQYSQKALFAMLIFISHSSQDDLFVDQLRAELRRYGYPTWVDHMDIPPGKNWADVVEEKLSQCQLMVLVMSPEGVASKEVKVEWMEFRAQDKTILPIKIRECPLPLLLRHMQYLDFTDKVPFDKQFKRLLDSLPPPPRAVTKDLTLSTQEFQMVSLKQEIETLRNKLVSLVGDGQVLFNFPELGKSQVFDLDKEKLFIGWYDIKSGLKPDIDLSKYEAFERGVSRQHALLGRTSKGLTITDLTSFNGTYIDDTPIPPLKPIPLHNEAQLRMGTLLIQVFFREQIAK